MFEHYQVPKDQKRCNAVFTLSAMMLFVYDVEVSASNVHA
jgi:hypothetical protein